ncbi:MAG: maleylacetoacetate isomerase [Stutzerimonas stutzeri]|nr:MAG: maleylacetoacetate isomerase [Stutzerimonas stutzeri]
MPALILHNFFNSSAAYRVRIALNLKGIEWIHAGVNVRKGEQNEPDYKAINPIGLVPALEAGGNTIIESLAIIDYLDRHFPEPRMVPLDDPARTRVLEIATIISCDIHPINNMRVLKYLTSTLGLDDAQKDRWIHHWIGIGFTALEALLPDHDGWCVGDAPTLADCCLVPQVANARRANFDFVPFPRIRRIAAFCEGHEAFAQAAPAHQPDYIVH